MVFNPDTQSLTCPYCEHRIEVAKSQEDIMEYDLATAEEHASHDWGSEKRVIHCESCGAETILDSVETAQFCAFCGSSHIVRNDESAGISPESLIPFKVSREAAMKHFSEWVNGRFFAPNALKTEHQVQKMSGIYIPCWTYDSDTFSFYTGEGGTYYYETQTEWVERDGKRQLVTKQVRKIRWWPTSGTYTEYFDDVLVHASKKVDDHLMENLRPFHLKELVRYRPEFLSGFLAERYSVGLKEGWEKAKAFIKERIRSGVIGQINADEVRNLHIRTQYRDVRYKHILLPVWICAYTYKNKTYQFMINGQTGEVQGHCPVSPWKVAGVIAASIAALLIIAKLTGII